MYEMRRIGLSFLFLVVFTPLFPQTILSNSNPSKEWRFIENDRYRLIFPSEFSPKAPKIASLLDTLYTLESKTMLDREPKKVSMIIRTSSSISNGFVTLGPRRSEVFIMPPQDYNFLGTNDWLDKVIIHEYRHVVQFDHANRGFNRLLSVLFGQSARLGMSIAGAPQWFWEGDAVLAETVFTRSGRGRITGYNNVFRANTISGPKYHYEKQLLGSYKDMVPSHYVLGNHMVPYLRSKTRDPEIWEKVTARSFSRSFLPFAFSSSMKKFSGKGVKDTYDEMMAELETDWSTETVGIDPLETIPVDRKVFTNYHYPHFLNDNSILVQKQGLGDIERLVKVLPGGEKKIYTQGIVNRTGMLSVRTGKVAWTELNFHPRWRNESYTVLKVLDLNTGKVRQVGNRTRYNGADLNPDGILLVTTETDENYNHAIVLVDLSGIVIKKFSNSDNSHFSHVRFDGRDHLIAVKTNVEGKSLVRLNTNSEESEYIIRPGNENFGNPFPGKDYIYFSSGITGVDEIYAIHRSTGKRLAVTDSKYGAYYPTVSKDNQELVINVLGELGMDIARIKIDPSTWKESSVSGSYSNPLYELPLRQEGLEIRSEQLEDSPLKEQIYGPMRGVLNIHSWGPFVSSSNTNFDIGVFSRDIMSTTSLFLGYNYDIQEGTGSYGGRISYQRFLPVVDLAVTRGNRKREALTRFLFENPEYPGNVDSAFVRTLSTQYTWNENKLDLGVRLPLVLTRSKYLTSMELGYEYSRTRVDSYSYENDSIQSGDDRRLYSILTNGELNTNTFNLFIFNTLKMSRRDVLPRFGQFLSIESTGSFGGDFVAGQTAIRTRWYLPGIGKHHSLNAFWSYQNRNITLEEDNYFLRNRVELPRGVSVSTFQNFYSMGVNYELPVLYPDLHLGPFLYIKRLRLNGFFDYAYGVTDIPSRNVLSSNEYYSTGAELRIDFNAARLLPEVNMGIRYAYDLRNNNPTIEIIFPTIRF